MPINSRDKITNRWCEELGLDETQAALFNAMVLDLDIVELARPFIKQDLANGLSINGIVIKYEISAWTAFRIRKESGYCEIIAENV